MDDSEEFGSLTVSRVIRLDRHHRDSGSLVSDLSAVLHSPGGATDRYLDFGIGRQLGAGARNLVGDNPAL
jgi:hypothetical protein